MKYSLTFALKRLALGFLLSLLAGSLILVSDLKNDHRGRQMGTKVLLYFAGYTDNPMTEESLRGLLDTLTDAGWARGVDYEIVIRNAQGDSSVLNSIIDNAIQEKPRILFTSSTPTLQAALKKIDQIPIIFTNSADPLKAGAGRDARGPHRDDAPGLYPS